jgi:hypothetical protein
VLRQTGGLLSFREPVIMLDPRRDIRLKAQRTGVGVYLRDPEGTVGYPGATTAMVPANGNRVVLRSRSRGFPETSI